MEMKEKRKDHIQDEGKMGGVLPFVALQSLASCAAGRGGPRVFPALKQVFSTAEQLQITPDIRRWLQANPDVELQNQ